MASIYLTSDVTIDGNVVINGNTQIINVENITAKDPLITLGSPSPGNGFDGGLIIEKNVNDIVNPTFTGTIVSATSTTATLQQSGNFTGWLIKITSGTGAGQYKYILSSAGNIITVSAWTTIPAGNYSLFSETHAAFVYRPTTDQFILGSTYNTGTDQFLNLTPKPLLVKNLVQTQQENIFYVGKHGSDSNSGTSISEALLTFGAAIAKNGAIICLDNGIYNETVVFAFPVFAPNATITTITSPAFIQLFSATTANLSSSAKISNFTTANLSGADLEFINGGAIVCSSSSTASGGKLDTITATGDLKIKISLLSGLISADGCFVSILASEITSSPLADSQTSGQIYINAAEIADYSVSGTGSVIFADSKRIVNHIQNFNNPHQVSISQVSPLTTKGDILAFSTASSRFPVGSDNYILSANSSQPFGLEWIAQNTQPFYSFSLAPGLYDITIQETVIANFTWIQSEFSNFVNGRIIFYLTAAATVKLEGSAIYGSVLGSTGYNILNISLPSTNDTLQLKVSTNSNAKISGVYFLFGLASTSFSASTAFDYKTISGNYTVLTTDDHIFCDTSGGPVSLSFPVIFKKKYKILDLGNAATNNITIAATGKTVININYGSAEVISNGINWYSY